ncbi:MAG: phenylalanine--tRNA ligase subunit beta [Bryobacterales bacterium]|nr:phenylalanine--tRNA ligase subunit beta [Bryobacterales bacterium]
MKFSYNWLRELVEDLDLEARALGLQITMKTAECEGVEAYGQHLERVVAARVLSAEPIAGGHNRKVTVDTGRYGIKVVVCGAPNCRPGMVTAYVPAGTELPGGRIGRLVIQGVESDGMLASGAELGINRDAAGILELEANPGDPLPGCRPDQILEIDNKSLTHRPDLWGHLGLAREVAAIARRRLLDPVRADRLPDGAAPIRVVIENFDLCPRYSALVFENVTVQPSPLWLQYRLQAVGLNPINNIVDVTNYVMAELAQPLHAFDLDLLHGDTIFVRPARDGEWLTALNEQTYRLDPANLVIADAKGPVALAGVIGGLDSAIRPGTRRIVLESACFQASSIRKTSSRLKLRTDASMRFEKAQDPENTVRGLVRAWELFEQVSPGIRLVGGLADCRSPFAPPAPIELPLDWLARKLGRPVPGEEVRDILERLCFVVREAGPRVFLVTPPSWRATRDVSIKDDLVEEVGRMIGYDTISPEPPRVACTVPPQEPLRLFLRSVREVFVSQGFSEVHNYSFYGEELARRFGLDPAEHLAVANPISPEQRLMRRSLLPLVFRNLEENSKHLECFRLFEIGREIHPQGEALPREIHHAVAAIYSRQEGEGNLYELARVAQCLMPGAEVRPAPPRSFEHPARTGEVRWRETAVGRLFELHPSLLPGRAALLDLDLERIHALGTEPKRYRPVRRFPTSAFDLSVIAPQRSLIGDLEKLMAQLAGEWLDSIEFLRTYSGPPIPEGSQSVSFRLRVGAADHTLSLEEVGQIRARIIEGLRQAGYDLRL